MVYDSKSYVFNILCDNSSADKTSACHPIVTFVEALIFSNNWSLLSSVNCLESINRHVNRLIRSLGLMLRIQV